MEARTSAEIEKGWRDCIVDNFKWGNVIIDCAVFVHFEQSNTLIDLAT